MPNFDKIKTTTEKVDPVAIWEGFKKFGQYGFNKSHAVAYSFVAYFTAKAWHDKKIEVIEYILNNGNKERFDLAMDHCVKMGLYLSYPSAKDFISDPENYNGKYKVVGGNLIMPSDELASITTKYEDVVEMLFDPDSEVNIAKMVLEGYFTEVSPDRDALATFVSALPKNWLGIIQELPIANCKIETILMKIGESAIKEFFEIRRLNDKKERERILSEYDIPEDSKIAVIIKKPRSKKPIAIGFRSKSSNEVIKDAIKLDLKYFKSASRQLSLNPSINPEDYGLTSIEGFESAVSNRKENSWREKDPRWTRDDFRKLFEERFCKKSTEYNKNTMMRFPDEKYWVDCIVLFEECRQFERSTKVTVRYKNGTDFYYIDNNITVEKDGVKILVPNPKIKEIIGLKKNSPMKLKLIFSPFLKGTSLKYIRDFDVVNLEVM